MALSISRFLRKALVFLAYSAVGLAVGVWVGGLFASREASGGFATWVLLDGPQKFQHLSHVEDYEDYNGLDVRAETGDGKIYRYVFEGGYWALSQPYTPVSEFSQDAHLREGCEANRLRKFYSVRTTLPEGAGHTVECGIQLQTKPSIGTVLRRVVVLSDAGKVWMLEHTPDLGKELLMAASGVLAGLTLGLAAWWFFGR